MKQPRVIVDDITKIHVDAIVNAANVQLAPGGGVCGAIHSAAGPDLAAHCASIGHCDTGDAKITDGCNLPAQHVIHTVGPVYRGGDAGDAEELASCYQSSLELAAQYGLNSIAFPSISTGIFGYPIEEAVHVAIRTIREWLDQDRQPQEVLCCCFTESDAEIFRQAIFAFSGGLTLSGGIRTVSQTAESPV